MADIGVDDGTCGSGAVKFEVYLDGTRVYESPVVRHGDNALPITVDVEGANEMILVVNDGNVNGNTRKWRSTIDSEF